MKTLILIVSMVLACTMTSVGQNYMGLKQAKILKDLGKPDSIGVNYIVYNDADEDGINIYYFDATGNCNSFEIIRGKSYLGEYQKMLNREFSRTCDNKYFKKMKKINYMAELVLMQDSFQIKIQETNTDLTCSAKLALLTY